jgi:hypothetical protein
MSAHNFGFFPFGIHFEFLAREYSKHAQTLRAVMKKRFFLISVEKKIPFANRSEWILSLEKIRSN